MEFEDIVPVQGAELENCVKLFIRCTVRGGHGKQLLLYNKELNNGMMPALYEYLLETKTIRRLTLKRNNLTRPAARVIKAILMDRNLSISELDVSMNKLEDEGIVDIAEALEKNRTVRLLFLSRTMIGETGATAIGNALKNNKSLIGLNIDHNPFVRVSTSKGRLRIADGVNANGRLHLLSISTSLFVRLSFVRQMIQSEVEGKEMTHCVLQYTHDKSNPIIKYIVEQWRFCKKKGIPIIMLPKELVQQVARISGMAGDDYLIHEKETMERVRSFLEAAGLKGGQLTMKRAKMLVVGATGAGKSSLCNSLIASRSSLTGEGEARATLCVQIKPWVVEGQVCSMYDFGGQEEYYMTHSFFVSSRAVVMIVVNLATYEMTQKCYNDKVQYWIDAIQSHAPGAKYLIVGTHLDLLDLDNEGEEKAAHIKESFEKSEETIKALYEKQIVQLEPESGVPLMTRLSSMLSIASVDRSGSLYYTDPDKVVVQTSMTREEFDKSTTFTKQYSSRLSTLKKNQSDYLVEDLSADFEDTAPEKIRMLQEKLGQRPELLFDKVFTVSCEASAAGLSYLSKELTSMLKDPIEHGVTIDLPKTYVQLTEGIDTYVKSHRSTSTVLDLKELGKMFVGRKKLFATQEKLEVALDLLHDTGYVLWYKHNKALETTVFLSPQWVVDMIKSVIRHDMFTNTSDALQSVNSLPRVSDEELTMMKNRFKEKAIIDVRLLSRLGEWAVATEPERYQMMALMKNLDLLCFMPRADEDAKPGVEPIIEVFIPLYLKSSFNTHPAEVQLPKVPRSLESLFQTVGEHPRDYIEGAGDEQYKHVQYRYLFANFYPEGVFLRLLVRIFSFGDVQFERITEHAVKVRLPGNAEVHIEEHREYIGMHGKSLAGALLVTAISFDLDSDYLRALSLFNCEVEELLKSFPGLEVGVFVAFIHEVLGKVVFPRDSCERLQLLKLQEYSQAGKTLSTSELFVVLDTYKIALSPLLPEVYQFKLPATFKLNSTPKLVRKSFLGRTAVELENIRAQLRSNSPTKKERFRILYTELVVILENLLRNLCKANGGILVRGWNSYFAFLKKQRMEGIHDVIADTKSLKSIEQVILSEKASSLSTSRLESIVYSCERLHKMLETSQQRRFESNNFNRGAVTGVNVRNTLTSNM